MNAKGSGFYFSPYLMGGWILLVLGVLNVWTTCENVLSTDFFLVWSLGKYGSLHQTKFGNLYTKESKRGIQKEISGWPAGKSDPKLQECLRQRADLNLCATPFYFAVHFPWLSFSSYEKDRFRYSLFLAFCFCLTVLLAAFLFQIAGKHTLFFLALCLLFFDPFLLSLSLGNSNEATLLGCVIFHCLQKRPPSFFGALIEGLWLTLLTLFKPIFVFSWILILMSHCVFEGWKRAVEFLGGAVGAVFLSLGICAFYFNLQESWTGWHDYLKSLDLAYWADSLRFGNLSLLAGVYAMTGRDLGFVVGGVLFLLACILLIALKRRFSSETLPFALRACLFWLGFFGFQLVSPLLWYHYLSHLALPFFLLFASLQKKSARGNGWRALMFLLSWLLIASRSSWEHFLGINQIEVTFQIYIAEAFLYGALLWSCLESGGESKKTLD